MKKKPESIMYNATFGKNFESIKNSGFLKGRARIAYAGENRNWSNISKESFDSALETLSLIPIVGNWIPEKNNYGGHDLSIEESGNSLRVVDKTRPYGVVPENHNAEWVDVEDENGNIKKYIECDVVLWKERYEEPVQKIIDGGVNQSMEIIPTEADYNEDTGYFDIKSFYYSALCLLGRDIEDLNNNVEPCFEDSEITAYQFNLEKNEFKAEFKLMMDELKESVKGGENVDIEERDEIEVEEEFVEIEETSVEEKETPIGGEEVSTEISLPETGEVVESDVEEVMVEEEPVEEEFETEEEVEEVATEEPVKDDIEPEVEDDATTEEEVVVEVETEEFAELQSKYTSLEIEFDLLKTEITELREFKSNALANEKLEAINEIFANYSTVLDKSDMEDLVEGAMDMELEALEKELSFRLVKKKFDFSKNTKKDSTKLPVMKDANVEIDPYGSASIYFNK